MPVLPARRGGPAAGCEGRPAARHRRRPRRHPRLRDARERTGHGPADRPRARAQPAAGAGAGRRRASITITDHPNGGPLLAGEQITPWPCFEEAVDDKCGFAPRYTWHDKQANGRAFAAYDPENPPADSAIATTTTDEGKTVPYVVRQEIGSQDRGEYRVAVLAEPGRAVAAVVAARGVEPQDLHHRRVGVRDAPGQTSSPSVA